MRYFLLIAAILLSACQGGSHEETRLNLVPVVTFIPADVTHN